MIGNTLRFTFACILTLSVFACGHTPRTARKARAPVALTKPASTSPVPDKTTFAKSPGGSAERATTTKTAALRGPVTFPLTRGEVDKLHLFHDPALLVIPGRFTPSKMRQYLVASGIVGEGGMISETSVLFFRNDRLDHKVTLPYSATGYPLAKSSVAQFDNADVSLGKREGPYYVAPFAGSGLDQIFLFQESGMGSAFVVFGYDGRTISTLLAKAIDNSYAYPIQTLEPGVLKIFTTHDELEQVGSASYRLQYRIYRWAPKSKKYALSSKGVQMARWRGPGSRFVYPVQDKHLSTVSKAVGSAEGAASADEARIVPSTATAARIPITYPLTTAQVDKLQVLPDKALFAIPGRFTPSNLRQYLVVSGTGGGPTRWVKHTSVFYFKGDHYDHRATISKTYGGGLSGEGAKMFGNRYIHLGKRVDMYYTDDFNHDGLDEVFMLSEIAASRYSRDLLVFGYDGHAFSMIFSSSIDSSFAYPVQTPKAGVLKIFPDQNVNEKVGAATYKLFYRMYRWDPAATTYAFTHGGSQLCTLGKRTGTGTTSAKFYPAAGS